MSKRFAILLICPMLLASCKWVDFVGEKIANALNDLIPQNSSDEQKDSDENDDEEIVTPPVIDEEFSYKEHYSDFDSSEEVGNKYWVRNGYRNDKDIFLSIWDRDNYSLLEDNDTKAMGLSLIDITKNGKTNSYGAEIVSYNGYQYGYFGTRMKTFKRNGTVQSFFTYNGPTSSHPEYEWDEIDIEFLGKDTTKVQFNYYDNGVGGHEYFYDLGFDSSLDYHDYGFVWREDKITWFVDFKPVYQVNASLNQWGFFMMNVWGGNPDNQTAVNWLGKYEKSSEIYTTYYDYVIAKEFN